MAFGEKRKLEKNICCEGRPFMFSVFVDITFFGAKGLKTLVCYVLSGIVLVNST